MSDFAQAGAICTLQQLQPRELEELEGELVSLAQTQPVALVLPCHTSDLRQPALAAILREVRQAAWISEVVVSVNGETAGVTRGESGKGCRMNDEG